MLLTETKIQAASFSGPLPHPDILAKFEQVVPGSAARIVERMEKQSDHRMGLEALAVRSEIHRSYWGLGGAVVVSLAILAGGMFCVLRGHDTAGAAIVTANIAAAITAFLAGSSQRRKEREAKATTQASMLGRK